MSLSHMVTWSVNGSRRCFNLQPSLPSLIRDHPALAILYSVNDFTCVINHVIIITRLVAVYLETHCNIGSKRAFPTGVLDR